MGGIAMRKFCAILLLLWPYLFAFPFLLLRLDGGYVGLIVYCALTPLVYIANIACACSAKDARSLSFWNLLLKVFHIPAYILIFFIGMILAGSLITGVPFGLILIPILVGIDYLLLLTTSAYGIKALHLAKKQGLLSKEFTIAQILLHFVFVLDVISSVITFCKIRQSSL